MNLYHGTNRTYKNDILYGRIDRTRGGGELGMGFYAGDNLAMAIIFAKGKYGNTNASVVEIEIDKAKFALLSFTMIKKRNTVFHSWRKIILNKLRFKYLYNVDVVMSPFATIEICIQYKFESQNAENFVNKMPKNLIL